MTHYKRVVSRSLVVAAIVAYGIGSAAAEPIEIQAEPFETPQEALADGGVRFVSALRLSSPHRGFGGLSGMMIEDDRLTAVVDQGRFVSMQLVRDSEGRLIDVTGGEIWPMLGPDGLALDKDGGDAEGVQATPDGVLVSFEQTHRLGLFKTLQSAERRFTPQPPDRLVRGNRSFEGLARAPDGALIVVAERATGPRAMLGRRNLGYRLARGRWSKFTFERSEGFSPTGLDFGPDGALYLLERRFTLLGGVWMRLRRFVEPSFHTGDLGAGETLAILGPDSGIDNMEGVVVERGADGAVIVTVLSDDNFNSFQSTVLLQLEVDAAR